MSATRSLLVAVFGSMRRVESWEGPLACCALCLVPCLALAEVLVLVGLLAYAAYWRARRAIGRALHGLAELLVPMAAERRLAACRAYGDGWRAGWEATRQREYDRGYQAGRAAALAEWDASVAEERWTVAPQADAADGALTPQAVDFVLGAPAAVLVAPSAAQVTDGTGGPIVQLDAPAVDAVVEADVIRRALAEHGSVRAAARQLGIAESTLRGRCRKLGIATPRARKPRQ
jgi:hypothetical protein